MLEKILPHQHKGTDTPKIDFKDIDGYIETLNSVPTHTPKVIYDAIKLYASGATYRLYLYDFKNGAWRYVNLT
jgi:hypothetical protein